MFEGFILLVDDQPAAAENSIAALKHYVPQEQILYTKDPAYALELINTRPVSLVFLDIEMPGANGFTLAKYVEKHHKGLPFVFLTGYAHFAAESYEYEPVDFLTKPVDIKRLGKTFERVERKGAHEVGKVAVKAGSDYVFVEPRHMLYICKEKRKIWIRMKDGQEYQVASSLEELERIFIDYGFFRCHQSFLISLSSITQVSSSKFGQTYEARLSGGTVVPVSRGKYAKLKEEIERLGIPFVRGIMPSEKGGKG